MDGIGRPRVLFARALAAVPFPAPAAPPEPPQRVVGRPHKLDAAPASAGVPKDEDGVVEIAAAASAAPYDAEDDSASAAAAAASTAAAPAPRSRVKDRNTFKVEYSVIASLPRFAR